jgi:3-oxoacyl-[acyl-carrier-protein] synthase II
MSVQRRRVVVTGLGVATPIGIGAEAYWEALLDRRCGLRRIAAFDPGGLPSPLGGELPEFAFGDCFPKTYRKSVKVMARDIVIAVAAAYQAVKDAGLITRCIVDRGESPGPVNVDSTRFGANIGAGLICADLPELAGALSSAVDEHGAFSLKKWGAEGMENLTPLWLLKFLPNMLACHVTIVHDAQAPSNTITCGDASSHLAIGEAFRTLSRGDADVCICGGAESKINPMSVARAALMGRSRLGTDCDPAEACRPFAADRAGGVPSEGGGLVILESLDHARARGARIYSELCGFGSACDITDWASPDPKGAALAYAIGRSLADAGAGPADVDFVMACGTGTADYDLAEMNAWRAALGTRLDAVPAATARGAIGLNGAGLGAIDFATTVLAMHHGTVPPSINTTPADAACGLRFETGGPRDARIGLAVSVGYSMSGGQRAALVIKRFQE